MFKRLVLLATLVLPACDPCAGVLSCERDPRVSYEGEILRHSTGQPVGGVPILVLRQSGVALESDSFTVTSGPDGRFHVVAEAEAPGEAIVDLVVNVGSPASYRVNGLSLVTTDVRGDGNFFPAKWVVDPYLDYRGELFFRGRGGPPPTSTVEFRRTGGVMIDPDTFKVFSDGTSGRFAVTTAAAGPGEVVGDLYVRIPGFGSLYKVSGVRFTTRYTEGPAPFGGRFGVGPHLPYAGLLRYADTLEPASNVEVEVRQIGGIPMEPRTYVTRTNPFGTFSLGGTVSQDGEVILEFTVRPGPPYQEFTVSDVRLSTYSDDGVGVLVDQWRIPRR